MRDTAGWKKRPETIEEKMNCWGANAAVNNYEARKAAKRREELRAVFGEIDADGNGTVDLDEFIHAFRTLVGDGSVSDDDLGVIFEGADVDDSGQLDFEEFVKVCEMDVMQRIRASSTKKQIVSARASVEPSEERFFGANVVGSMARSGGGDIADQYTVAESQALSMNLYETRVASMQRAVAMYVMFHEMGKRCAQFWPNWSLGALRYRMDRTHSIMRIATTASPVSGSEVRSQMHQLALLKEWRVSCHAMARISRNWQHKLMIRQHVSAMRVSYDEQSMTAKLGLGELFSGGDDDAGSKNQTADVHDVLVDGGKPGGIAIMADAESFRKSNGEDDMRLVELCATAS